MRISNDIYTPSASTKEATRVQRYPAPRSAGQTPDDSSSGDGVKVSLSAKARELTAANFDGIRVQQLRGAIQSNSYVVDSKSLAQKMLNANGP